jgi:hypothetical protein
MLLTKRGSIDQKRRLQEQGIAILEDDGQSSDADSDDSLNADKKHDLKHERHYRFQRDSNLPSLYDINRFNRVE